MNIITSNKNPLIKEIKTLKVKKNRDGKGLYFIEGIRFLEEAVKSDAQIEYVVISDSYEASHRGEIKSLTKYPVWIICEKLFKDISDTENPQGVLAVIRMKQYDFKSIEADIRRFIVLDAIQDPGNMGTIIRTADAAGFSGVVLSKGCVDIYNPKVLRSTMGSIFHIPFIYSDNLPETLVSMKSMGTKVYAAALEDADSIFSVNMKSDIAIIIGNEANGISQEALSCADAAIKIPMPGQAESLNASVAASIIMYESVRQRIE